MHLTINLARLDISEYYMCVLNLISKLVSMDMGNKVTKFGYLAKKEYIV